MISGQSAVIFNMLSIMMLSVLVTIFISSALIRFKLTAIASYPLSTRRLILWLLAVSPWLIGFLSSAVLLLIASDYSPLAESQRAFHLHHIQLFHLTNWHGITLVLGLVMISLLLIQKGYCFFKSQQRAKLLNSVADTDGSDMCLLDTDSISAFTAGFLEPKTYITTALRKQLTAKEYTIVRLHEYEHKRCFDPLKKFLFQSLTAVYPQPIAHYLSGKMTLVMELGADSAVSRVVPDKGLIAMTLVKVRRLSSQTQTTPIDTINCHFEKDQLEDRVNYLLVNQEQKQLSYVGLLIVAATMLVFCTLSVDVLHHLIEFPLSH
ncbi:MAG: hypothetical protein KBT50_05290 [Cycloclasticus sp.]|nr:hypothetical protein [Cycloclasticus sp.]MBQ0790016.1 hypothetical protein [Cycloclasticus sp.]